MNILTIETTGHFASVALGDKQIKNDTDYSHLQEIAPMCLEILAASGLDGHDLDAIAVSKGPGSFTGIRIGMATAKGLAQIWNKPIVAVPTLDSFAWRSDIAPDNIVVPVFDARRSQVYAGAFCNRKTLVPAAAYDIEEFKDKLSSALAANGFAGATATQKVLYFGDGTQLIGQESLGVQEAVQVLALAEEMFNQGITETCYSAEPEYMRLAEAERKLKEKQAEK